VTRFTAVAGARCSNPVHASQSSRNGACAPSSLPADDRRLDDILETLIPPPGRRFGIFGGS